MRKLKLQFNSIALIVSIIAGIFLNPVFIFARETQFDWLIGKWRLDSEKFESYEVWQKKRRSLIW